jgi:hypothetical protein
MPGENVEILRRLVDAFYTRDDETALALMGGAHHRPGPRWWLSVETDKAQASGISRPNASRVIASGSGPPRALP